MRTSDLLLLGTLFLTPVLSAQNSRSANLTITESQNCPVAAYARRTGVSNVVQTDGRTWQPEGFKLLLHMMPNHGPQIVAATLVLHGIGTSPRVQPAGTRGSDVSETVHLTALTHYGQDSEVVPQKLTNVRSFEITDLTFADRKRWQSSSSSFCSVTPNGVLLVANSN